jgi:aminopeptidase YwaD
MVGRGREFDPVGAFGDFFGEQDVAFMVSLKTARGMRERLAKGESILLHALVKAGQHAGNYEVVTATIPGADPKLKEEEIAFSCHLDHQRPGANDNASGCATILEVARTLKRLTAAHTSGGCTPIGKINDEKMDAATREEFERLEPCEWWTGGGVLAEPARTIRFIFPPEIEGTLALLNGKPEFAKRIKAVIHMDMVGGGQETKAVFHVTRGPMSLPSFVHDVAWAFAEFVNEESYKFAATGEAKYPMVAPEGGKEPLRAEYSAYTMGSDHDVYQDSSFGIPAIYLNDWPDRYIHTNFDTAANIDPTKLKRAAFIGAASGYFLANPPGPEVFAIWALAKRGTLQQESFRAWRSRHLPTEERLPAISAFCVHETELFKQLRSMIDELPKELREGFDAEIPKCWTGYAPIGPIEPKVAEAMRLIFRRSSQPKGPLAVFGYDYFAEHAKAVGVAAPKLLGYEGLWGSGEEYAYEVLDFADGKRNAREIRDAVSAEYGPVPLEMVVEFLKALEKIGLVEQVK